MINNTKYKIVFVFWLENGLILINSLLLLKQEMYNTLLQRTPHRKKSAFRNKNMDISFFLDKTKLLWGIPLCIGHATLSLETMLADL